MIQENGLTARQVQFLAVNPPSFWAIQVSIVLEVN